ncbi:hypothetical protein H9X85_02770 [Anaerotignum lactatifermentans]|uniref:Uncharacterized protein n=1 Tax=Anaerotignum lactatifermentans TaxID=160404 RepID=A0ABS2GBH6_9FIRM|nr:hypothetical protein [Anaerotignum lactatifermentans]MBM6828556.1 hypothetical protein [Anaerotignum lactatifermentans]MBM6877963.1 hypothetical protein [Anaerotignum lactatifermentans]MBM6950138.1 hypothetical protein [Anaerotignum lactatifermentans]
MKKNALPCIILAAIMAAGSAPAVHGEELTASDVISSQETEHVSGDSWAEDESEAEASDKEEETDENEAPEAFPLPEQGHEDGQEEEDQQKEAITEDVEEDTPELLIEDEEILTPLALESVESTSTITVRVRMDYPMTKSAVQQQNISMEIAPASTGKQISPVISLTYLDENGDACGDMMIL